MSWSLTLHPYYMHFLLFFNTASSLYACPQAFLHCSLTIYMSPCISALHSHHMHVCMLFNTLTMCTPRILHHCSLSATASPFHSLKHRFKRQLSSQVVSFCTTHHHSLSILYFLLGSHDGSLQSLP